MALGLVKRLPLTELKTAVYSSIVNDVTVPVGVEEGDAMPYMKITTPTIRQPETTKSTPMLEASITLEVYSDQPGEKEAQDILESAMAALETNPINLANDFAAWEGPFLESAVVREMYDQQKQREFRRGECRLTWKVVDTL